jgi:hypothetical protein
MIPDNWDIPPRIAACFAALTLAVAYAIHAGAPAEAYEALMIVAAALALWRGQVGPRWP